MTRNVVSATDFAPDSADDGATIKLTQQEAGSFIQRDPTRRIPGLVAAQVPYYLQALPKTIRQRLIPLAATAERITPLVEASDQPIELAIQQILSQEHIHCGTLQPECLPDWCRLRLIVTDDIDGRTEIVYDGRDWRALAQHSGSLPDPLALVRVAWSSDPSRSLPPVVLSGQAEGDRDADAQVEEDTIIPEKLPAYMITCQLVTQLWYVAALLMLVLRSCVMCSLISTSPQLGIMMD